MIIVMLSKLPKPILHISINKDIHVNIDVWSVSDSVHKEYEKTLMEHIDFILSLIHTK